MMDGAVRSGERAAMAVSRLILLRSKLRSDRDSALSATASRSDGVIAARHEEIIGVKASAIARDLPTDPLRAALDRKLQNGETGSASSRTSALSMNFCIIFSSESLAFAVSSCL